MEEKIELLEQCNGDGVSKNEVQSCENQNLRTPYEAHIIDTYRLCLCGMVAGDENNIWLVARHIGVTLSVGTLLNCNIFPVK